jgi:hypothetical protein
MKVLFALMKSKTSAFIKVLIKKYNPGSLFSIGDQYASHRSMDVLLNFGKMDQMGFVNPKNILLIKQFFVFFERH